jgi:cation diffusion facilitator CzcD-associated flavoprotein CzcO
VKVAKSITIFQRTPNWVIPRQDAPVTPFWRGVYKYLPPIRWRRRAAMMDFRESFYDAVIDGSHPFADELRRQSKEMMQTQLADRPDLWEKLTPKYNPGCKRVIISDDYYPTLALPNVALETRPIHRIGSNSVSVVGEDGKPDVVEADYDLLVCATGFQTTEFMHPIQLTGRNGRKLSDVWHKGAQAYNGTCVEDMVSIQSPPNTNPPTTTSLTSHPAQLRHALRPQHKPRPQLVSVSTLPPKTKRLTESHQHNPHDRSPIPVHQRPHQPRATRPAPKQNPLPLTQTLQSRRLQRARARSPAEILFQRPELQFVV